MRMNLRKRSLGLFIFVIFFLVFVRLSTKEETEEMDNFYNGNLTNVCRCSSSRRRSRTWK
uniref:Uncharacterized protein n=1 Tax=Lepeophtheirus salmonis TaxID=72036 RepID=A0A0K2TWZ1_LEPSM